MIWIVIAVGLYSFVAGFLFGGIMGVAANDPNAKDSHIPWLLFCSVLWPLLLLVRTK